MNFFLPLLPAPRPADPGMGIPQRSTAPRHSGRTQRWLHQRGQGTLSRSTLRAIGVALTCLFVVTACGGGGKAKSAAPTTTSSTTTTTAPPPTTTAPPP